MGVLDDERREHYSQTKSRIGETGGEEKGEENAAAQLSAAAQRGTKLRHTKHSPTTFPFPSPVQRNSAETATVFFSPSPSRSYLLPSRPFLPLSRHLWPEGRQSCLVSTDVPRLRA